MTAVAQIRRPEIVTRSIQVVKLGEDSRALELGALPDAPLAEGPATQAPPSTQKQSQAGQGNKEASSRSSTFRCTVDKDGQKLGVRVEYVRDKCIVTALTQGSIPAWNAANADKAICVGDRLLQVNGETASGVQLAEKLARSTGQVEILVERPSQMRIPIQEGPTLGLKVSELLDGFGLEVSQVKDEGQIASFNKEKQMKVQEGDRIVEVNGKQAGSTELFEMISSAACKEILVYAYS